MQECAWESRSRWNYRGWTRRMSGQSGKKLGHCPRFYVPVWTDRQTNVFRGFRRLIFCGDIRSVPPRATHDSSCRGDYPSRVFRTVAPTFRRSSAVLIMNMELLQFYYSGRSRRNPPVAPAGKDLAHRKSGVGVPLNSIFEHPDATIASRSDRTAITIS
jgi:hypothetical protein